MRKSIQLLLLVLLLLVVSDANAGTAIYDDFSSYPLYGSMNPPSSGQYASSWLSDGATGGGPWIISADPTYAPSFGQFALTNGDPSRIPNDRWLSFTLHESQPIKAATLQFNYLVQTNASLGISISGIDSYTDLVSVPYSFTKRANNGEIQDSTGLIDLTPYLTSGSSTLVVRFDAETIDASFSHIRLDNFSLNIVPEPSTFALLGAGGIGLIGWAWRRKRRAA